MPPSSRSSSLFGIRTAVTLCVVISVFQLVPQVAYLFYSIKNESDASFLQPDERSQVYHQRMLPASTSAPSTMMAVSSSPPPISIRIPPAIQKEASVCGRTWNIFLEDLNKNRNTEDEKFVDPLIWTVSGGPEYRKNLKMLLDHWHLLDPKLPFWYWVWMKRRPLRLVRQDMRPCIGICQLVRIRESPMPNF